MKQFFMVNFLKVHLNAPRGLRGDSSQSLSAGHRSGPGSWAALALGPTCQRISRLISLFCLWPWAQLNRKKRQHRGEGVNWRWQQKQLCSHLERSRQQVRTQCELIKIETFRDH